MKKLKKKRKTQKQQRERHHPERAPLQRLPAERMAAKELRSGLGLFGWSVSVLAVRSRSAAWCWWWRTRMTRWSRTAAILAGRGLAAGYGVGSRSVHTQHSGTRG